MFTLVRFYKNQNNFSCKFCGNWLMAIRNLITSTVHSHFPTNEFCCDICGKLFSSKYKLKYHKFIHSMRRYECKICLKNYTAKYSLAEHRYIISPNFPGGVQLNNYSRTISTINILKGHEKMLFNRQDNFSCDICGKCLASKRSLEAHLHLHFPTNEFACDICGKLSPSERQLKKHKSIHTGRRYECKICLKSYTAKYSLATHKRHHQPGGLPKEYLCEICGYHSDHLGHLKSHILNVHLHKKLYICDICGHGYRNSNKFTNHMATHSQDKRYICALCDRCFKRRDDVKHHITRVHPKTMGLQKAKLHCSLCKKVYTTKEGLMKHMVRHSGERKFVCDLCGKRFMHRFDLSKHKKSSIHNGNCPKYINTRQYHKQAQ
uniref:C2H2-type domain-containing protein n=1 Tax=Timema genevievae TaxID=629358 RepID=A0A7R9K4J8_TIMGE|nr:unnamed protein product [Timema genevievae]